MELLLIPFGIILGLLILVNIGLNSKIKLLEKKLFIITNNIRKENFAREKDVDKQFKIMRRDVEELKVTFEIERDGGTLKKLFDEYLEDLSREE
jgi:hypothetical protein